MKTKILILMILVIVVGGVAYAVLSGMTSVYRSDEHVLKDKSRRFFECIKFKEFDEAAAFHSPDEQKLADIPKLIEDLFKIPPEQLDIQQVDIVFAEVDTSGLLGKVKARCTVQLLNSKEIRNVEAMLYWKKEGTAWYLKLRSSLKKAFPGAGS